MSNWSPQSTTSPPPCSSPADRAVAATRARRPRSASALAACLLIVPLHGCADTGGKLDAAFDSAFKKIFQPRRSAQQYMLAAVSDSDADVRREAVARVARSKKVREDWAIKGLIAIATLESDPQTRSVAIRALAATDDLRAADVMLRILNYNTQPPAEIRPPEDEARWEATVALADLSQRARVPPELHDLARTTLLERLKRDSNRLVRVAAARGLGCYPHADSVAGLIDGLRDADFAVIAECESALVRLTGHTADYSAPAWDAWASQHADTLFAGRGTVPDSRKPPYSTRLGKFAYDARQLWDWAFPPKK